ncbi:hypothetical protein TNCV_783761 [Trichonephila clavipes]|nr:hypothetical protein TNCV_783761 [Trichonephila clavipes]
MAEASMQLLLYQRRKKWNGRFGVNVKVKRKTRKMIRNPAKLREPSKKEKLLVQQIQISFAARSDHQSTSWRQSFIECSKRRFG